MLAAKLRKLCFLPKENHCCESGKVILGYVPASKDFIDGENFLKRKRFSSIAASKVAMKNVPILAGLNESLIGTLTSPLDACPFEPDVILFFVKPRQAMLCVQAIMWQKGKPLSMKFTTIYAVCSEGFALPYLNQEPSISLMCPSSRKLTKISADYMVFSIHPSILEELKEGLKMVVRAAKRFES